jgi:hypothetical protein
MEKETVSHPIEMKDDLGVGRYERQGHRLDEQQGRGLGETSALSVSVFRWGRWAAIELPDELPCLTPLIGHKRHKAYR